jgi:hypothetical protein
MIRRPRGPDGAVAVGAPGVTMNVRPAIFSVPVLWVVPVFAATLKLTGPVPLPVPPLVMVIHDALLVAVHAQPVPVVTVPVPR